MQKPTSLRKALEAALEELRIDPTRLALWVEDGAVRSRSTGDLSFSFEYPLSVLLRDMKTDIALVTLAITRWLHVHQPNLLAGGSGDSFKFETDILDNEKADILVTLQLTEPVKVTPKEGGGFDLEYLAEPDPLFASDAGFAETAAPPLQTADTIVAD
ncbi:phage tail protein [Qipengyuania citrea]|uniref:phage tail protein n=1 Tax=Qipengyuania citrea TaxID=225971 RepID=UPI00209D8A65|nr:phage tail protein [Qipengyuania citrea]MCP2016835.1 hypothetical protein [Qipengyuania citrea]